MNNSGFGGFSYTNIYPNFSGGLTQAAETVPDTEEQQAYVSVDVKKVEIPVDAKTSKNFWLIGGVGILLIVMLGAAK